MKLETLSFQEILSHTPDIFEAVVVASHRARQIYARRAAENAEFDNDYPEEDYPLVSPVDEDAYVEEEKPSVLAMEDFLTERLNWRYVEQDDGEDSAGTPEGS